MQREIKFRAWDGKEMHHNVCINHEGKAIKPGFRATDWTPEAQAGTPMMYTGQKDMDHNEIYEDDIIECEYHPDLPSTKGIPLVWRGVVKYFENHTHFSVVSTNGNSYSVGYSGSAVKRWQRIGNIHQNPELI